MSSKPIRLRGSPQAERLSSHSLPKRFPVGSKYVVEVRGGAHDELPVFSRYVELPGGRRINVPANSKRSVSSRGVAARRRTGKAAATRSEAATAPRRDSAKSARKFAARTGTS
jgi:hypothetical protein